MWFYKEIARQQNIVRIFTLTRFCFHIKTIKTHIFLSKLCGKKLIGTSQKCDMLLRNEQKIRNFNNEAKVFRKSQLNFPTLLQFNTASKYQIEELMNYIFMQNYDQVKQIYLKIHKNNVTYEFVLILKNECFLSRSTFKRWHYFLIVSLYQIF